MQPYGLPRARVQETDGQWSNISPLFTHHFKVGGIESSAALLIHLLDHLPVRLCVVPAPVAAAQSLINDVSILCKGVII